jgi:hypothetical protein
MVQPPQELPDDIDFIVEYADSDDGQEPEQEDGSIVIPDCDINMLFDYPLDNPAVFTVRGPFTRTSLKDKIVEIYQQIYEEEGQTSTVEAGVIPGMYNATTTTGTYGIWGHNLGDLAILGVRKDGSTGEDNLYTIEVES